MSPKEKAVQLVELYWKSEHQPFNYEHSKRCALIAVEFAREQFYKYCSAEMGTDGTYDDHFDRLKQEIEKL